MKSLINYPDRPIDDGLFDSRLMTECLTIVYKLNPANTLRQTIPIFLSAEAPTIFKTTVVRSCYNLTAEELEKSGQYFDEAFATSLRNLFQVNISIC
jgi:hypothetical protein